MVVSPWGDSLYRASKNDEVLKIVELNIDKVNYYREKIPLIS